MMLKVAKLFSLLLVYLVIRLMQGKLKNKEASVPLPFLLCPVLSIMLIRVVWQVTIYSTAEISAGERLMLIIICMLVAVFNIVILEIYNRNVQMQSQIMEQQADAAAGQDGIGKLYAAGTGYAELQADPA